MNNQVITQQDWQTQRRQARRLHIAPQARTETNWQTLKRQATEDGVTVTLEIVCICLFAAVVVAQAGILWNW